MSSEYRSVYRPLDAAIQAGADIATIEAADATKLGRVPPALFRHVARRLAGELGLDAGGVIPQASSPGTTK